jgi:hypothetical protein
MPNLAWPTGRLFYPQMTAFGEARKRRSSGEPVMGGDAQMSEVPYSHRWSADLVLMPSASRAERAAQEAWISRIARGDNRAMFHHFQHPVPYGTLRGSLTLSGALAQGATSAVIAGGINGQTANAGDMLGITTTAAYPTQLVRVVVGGTVSAGLVTVQFEPPLRASAANGASVTWDRPAALWRLVDGSWKQTSSARNAQANSLSFLEVLA